MNEQQKLSIQKRNDAKTLLSAVRWTTTIGAVSLTLAGWGLLSQAEAFNAAPSGQSLPVVAAPNLASNTANSADGTRAAPGIVPGAIKQFASNIAISTAEKAKKEAKKETKKETKKDTEEDTEKDTEKDTKSGAASSAPPIVLPTLAPPPVATATSAPTATPLPTTTPLPTATPLATATPAPLYTLNIMQWVQDSNGDSWAVVRDNSGVLWYVWGPDVQRIEQGLDPQVQPQPVNATARSRGS